MAKKWLEMVVKRPFVSLLLFETPSILYKLFFLIIQNEKCLIFSGGNVKIMDIVCPQLPCSSGFFNLKITMQTQITFCLCMHQHHRIPFWKTCQLNCLLTLLEFSLTKICHRQIKFLQWFDIRHWFSNLTHSFNSHVS